MKSFYLIFVLMQTVYSYLDCLDNFSLTTGLYGITNCTIENLEGNYELCGATCFNNSDCVGFNYINLVNVTQCELLCNVPVFESCFYSSYFEKTGTTCYVKSLHFFLYFVGGIFLIFIPIAIYVECEKKRRRYINEGYQVIN